MQLKKHRIKPWLPIPFIILFFLHFQSVAATSPSGLVSDSFDGALNTSIWSFIDPLGDSELAVTGHQLAISVPAGTEHNLWVNRMNAPLVMQKTVNGDTDFIVETKIDSPISQNQQAAGIIVWQDSDNLLRFDVHSENSQLLIFAANFGIKDGEAFHRKTIQSEIANTFPIYLRVKREIRSKNEHRWTYYYSYNGESWTQAGSFLRGIKASSVGLFAANPEDNPPAYTGLFDYFKIGDMPFGEDTTPPILSNIQVNQTNNAATITWETDEPSASIVNYGLTDAYGATAHEDALVTSHTVTLTGLTPSTPYHFDVISTDSAGNQQTSKDFTFTTQSASGLISDNFNGSINGNWRFIDPLGDSSFTTNSNQLEISVTAGKAHNLYTNRFTAPRVMQAINNTDFTIETKLDAKMSKRYQAAGFVVQQDDDDLMRFDVYYDGSKLILFAGTFVNGSANHRIEKEINNAAPLYLRVQRQGDQWTYEYSNGNLWTTAGIFTHLINASSVGLFAANPENNPPAYTGLFDYFKVDGISQSNGGKDISPPLITNIRTSVTNSTAKITWSTNESADSVVNFGRSSNYGATSKDQRFTTDHSIILTGLMSGEKYHYQVSSTDTSGNVATSHDFTFITDAAFNNPLVNWTRLSSTTGDLPTPPPNIGQAGLNVVDLNKDGQMDYVLSQWGITGRNGTSEMLLWYRNTGNYTFKKYIIDIEKDNLSHTHVFRDIDHDGDIDLILGDASDGRTISWWENPYPNYDPNKPWVRRTIISNERFFHDATWGDFDGDGQNEYISWNQNAFKLLLFEIPRNPKTTQPWPVTSIYSWTGGDNTLYRGADVIDINLDGKVDFVGGCGWFEHISGTRFIHHPIDDAQGYGNIVAGQLIPGGRPEIVCQTELHGGPLKMYQWTGQRWQAKTLITFIERSHTLQIGDINLDGNLDLMLGEIGHWGTPLQEGSSPKNPDAKLIVLYGYGNGDFKQQTVSVGPGHLEGQLADIDDDGDLDIVSKPYRYPIPSVNIWLNDAR